MKKRYVMSGLLTLLLMAGCQQAGTTSVDSSAAGAANSTANSATSTSAAAATQTTNASTKTKYGQYAESDYDTNETGTTIQLATDSAEIDGSGATFKENTLTITQAGTYVLSGELKGQVVVKGTNKDAVHLVLKGVTITNDQGPAINVEQADKVTLTLSDGTENTVSDGSDYQLATGEDEPDATIFSKDDLTINGSGSLVVTGNYSNGIRGKDDVVIVSGTISVTAKNNAIKAKDGLSIAGGTFTLKTTEGDGLQTSNTEETDKGWLAIDGGTFTIEAGRDAVQAATALKIQTGKFTLKTADGAESSVNSEESYKGLKAGTSVQVDDGTFDINSADDGVHSNGTVTIDGGQWQIATGDDGVHADTDLVLNGGQMTISKSYEGLEGSTITFNDGTFDVTADDDGVNAGGGSDTTTDTGSFGEDTFGGPGGAPGGPGGGDQADDSKEIIINGGTLLVHAEGDGLDSNGNITMTAGTVFVDGPSRGGNGSLDYNGTFDQNGGVLLATGTADMAQATSETSQQKGLAVYLDSSQDKTLQVTAGETTYSVKPTKAYQFIFVSVPEMQAANDVTLAVGGTVKETGIVTGAVTDSQKLGTYTLDNTITQVDQSGNAVSGNQMSGMGGFR